MECISEAQRNLLDYDVTFEILLSVNIYLHVIRMSFFLKTMFDIFTQFVF